MSFAVDLILFKGILAERGMQVFSHYAEIPRRLEGLYSSQTELSEMIDGLIWTREAQSKYRMMNPYFDLPGQCPLPPGMTKP